MIRKTLVLVLIAAFTFACATTDDDPNKKTKRGAVIGAVIGGVAGAVIGNQSGSNRTGAVIRTTVSSSKATPTRPAPTRTTSASPRIARRPWPTI